MKIPLALCLTACVTVTGCDGDDKAPKPPSAVHSLDKYEGEKASAEITPDNQKNLAFASIAAVQKVIARDLASTFSDTLGNSPLSIASMATSNIEQNPLPYGTTLREDCGVNGNLSITLWTSDNGESSSTDSGVLKTTYRACDLGIGHTYDGHFNIFYAGGWSDASSIPQTMDIEFNLKATSTDSSLDTSNKTFSGAMNCTEYGKTCSYQENYKVDNKLRRIDRSSKEQLEVANLYNVKTYYYHGQTGQVMIDAKNFDTESCGGDILVTSLDNSTEMTIRIPDCRTIDVTHMGVTTDYKY